jgi:hypothetical protein
VALDQTALKNALAAVFASMPASASAAADALAGAYDTYATAGRFGTNVPVLTGRRAALKSTLEAGMLVPGAPGVFAAAWSSGVNTYWTGVAVASVAPPQSGTTAGCPGASALTGALSTVFANLANTANTCAAGVAAALDTATKTVTATVTPPAGTTFPCS